jgi:hypothetical protein
MYKWLTFIITLLALGLFTAVSEAGTIRLQGTHTRAEIARACQKVNGTPFGTKAKSGGFGCDGPGGVVSCTADGTCDGTCSRCGTRRVVVVTGPRKVSGVLGGLRPLVDDCDLSVRRGR